MTIMLPGILPPGVLEALLLIVLIGALLLVVRGVRRRHAFARVEADAELPDLETAQRITATVRRVYRDAEQGVWMADVSLGRKRLTLCAVDFAAKAEAWRGLVTREADIALYALSSLAPGGVEAMRDQIKDYDKVKITPDLVRLVPVPDAESPNDFAVIARTLSHRTDAASGIPVDVYRAEVIRSQELNLILELAVPKVPGTTPYPDGSMVHGSARLYGYLPG
jgi:hypothetical protein